MLVMSACSNIFNDLAALAEEMQARGRCLCAVLGSERCTLSFASGSDLCTFLLSLLSRTGRSKRCTDSAETIRRGWSIFSGNRQDSRRFPNGRIAKPARSGFSVRVSKLASPSLMQRITRGGDIALISCGSFASADVRCWELRIVFSSFHFAFC